MTKRLLFLILILGLFLALTTLAFAADDDDSADDDSADDDSADDDSADDDEADDDDADDDDAAGGTFFDSSVEFTNPLALEPETPYEFTILVTNNATLGEEKGDWINQVDLILPSQDYSEPELEEPAPLYGDTGDDYEIDHWEASFDANTATITWQAFGVVTSVAYGDIREGDSLSFQFVATTDAVPSNTFLWVLYSDEGNTVNGEACPGGCDDDDDAVDDDDAAGDDDDDDDSGGCGC